jgi:hypothetical protein
VIDEARKREGVFRASKKIGDMVSVSSRLLRRIAAGSSAYARMARWDDDGRRGGAFFSAYATSSGDFPQVVRRD